MRCNRLLKSIASALFALFCTNIIVCAQTKSEIAAALIEQKEGHFAQDFVPEKQEKPFVVDITADIMIAGAGVALIGLDYYLDKKVNDKKAGFSGTLYDKDSVSKIDQLFMQPYSATLATAGDVFQIASILTPAVLLMAPKSEWMEIGIMYAESVLLAYGFKELGKNLVFRARPYMYESGYPQKKVDDGDWNDSFPSGHTTLAFNGAAFTSYVFSTYFPDSNLKIPVIAASYALAGTTAALRLASGNHFLTDVIAGAIIGTQTGLLVPILHTYLAQLDSTGRGFTTRVLPNGLLLKYNY